MLTPREKSPLLEKLYSEDKTHDAASSRIVSPTHYQRVILVPWGCRHPDQPVCLVHKNVPSLTSWMFPEGADVLTNWFVWSTTMCPLWHPGYSLRVQTSWPTGLSGPQECVLLLWHPGCITVDLSSESLFFIRQLPSLPKTFCHFVQKLQQTPQMVRRYGTRQWQTHTRQWQTQAACQSSSNGYGTRRWQTLFPSKDYLQSLLLQANSCCYICHHSPHTHTQHVSWGPQTLSSISQHITP